MSSKVFVNGSSAVHRDHGTGIIRECADIDYAYFTADIDGVEYFAYREYLSPVKDK